jgi:hypothetical protein
MSRDTMSRLMRIEESFLIDMSNLGKEKVLYEDLLRRTLEMDL